MKAGVCTLIGKDPEAHGVLEAATESSRTVYCTVRSIGQSEMYQAMAAGLNPELKIILAHGFEYKGEDQLEYNGVRYDILRTYEGEDDGIELTVQRVRRNAAAPAETEPDPEDETEPTKLKATKIPFAEYAWDKRPDGDFGVVALEFEADSLTGDDKKVARAWEGSVDLYTKGRNTTKVALVEGVLAEVCEGCWALSSIQYENDTGFIHHEWVFQVEG